MKRIRFALFTILGIMLSEACVLADDNPELALVYAEDFENGAENWEPTDPAAWKLKKSGDGHVYSQVVKQSQYQPPYRSPYNVSLLKDVTVGGFVLGAKVLSTHQDYGHRDVCLFFG